MATATNQKLRSLGHREAPAMRYWLGDHAIQAHFAGSGYECPRMSTKWPIYL